MDKKKVIQMLAIIAGIIVIAASVSKIVGSNSQTLSEYASEHGLTPDIVFESDTDSNASSGENGTTPPTTAPTEEAPEQGECSLPTETPSAQPTAEPTEAPSMLVGASLNGTSQEDKRVEYQNGFYYEPLSDNLRRYMTGVSYPADEGENSVANPAITFDELRYVHIYHYDFDGRVTEGELVCNEYIAQDLVEIFYELYRNEYQIEKVLLIDEYDGDDDASMTDNNSSCFNYRVVSGSSSLSKHALGLAIDINPLYNPYITYNKDGSRNVAPEAAYAYADRSADFPYKIDENDLCCKLFLEHGFIWGGNWNSVKDYQHFQKTKP